MRFILVDKIVSLDPGKKIVAEKTLPASEEIYKDHFPGFPVVPGVLLTEMMAQAAGKCLDAEKRERGKAMLARIKSASFHAWVRPDETAVIHASIKNSQDSYAIAECFITVNEKKVCKAELFFSFASFDTFAVGYADELLEQYMQKKNNTVGAS
jgi:3-hydroxyacyl-[acyl-carrier-protein] dehydratase